jgi:hypothetical protein
MKSKNLKSLVAIVTLSVIFIFPSKNEAAEVQAPATVFSTATATATSAESVESVENSESSESVVKDVKSRTETLETYESFRLKAEELESELDWWPWKTDDDGTNNDNATNESGSDSDKNSDSDDSNDSDACDTHTNCTSCIRSSIFCHWCNFDSQCHAKGSIHGCAYGASCPDSPKPKPSDKCASHSNCTECTLSSSLCHWCAFDEACHAIASWYGCSHGVNCFNNDRCKRDKPERIDWKGSVDDDTNVWKEVGVVPVIIIFIIGLTIFCCSSICFVTVGAVKGAYDDWAFVNYGHHGDGAVETGASGGHGHGDESNDITSTGGRARSRSLPGIDEEEQGEEHCHESSRKKKKKQRWNTKWAFVNYGSDRDLDVSGDDTGDESGIGGRARLKKEISTSAATEATTSSSSLYVHDNDNDDQTKNKSHDDLDGDVETNNQKRSDKFEDNPRNSVDDTQPLLSTQDEKEEEDEGINESLSPSSSASVSMSSSNSSTTLVTAHPSPSRLPSFNNQMQNFTSSSSTTREVQPSSSKRIKCFYNVCLVYYIISIITAVAFTSLSIYYFPKVPEFNVCSDEFAWNSIIDSLTSLKVEASFQVLSSVKNKNHLGIELDRVGGSFYHNGEDVGTFSMETTTIEANSITDVLVTCSVRPDKWEALGLVSDYYRGKLQFVINVNGYVKIKGIRYSFPIQVKDVMVRVSDASMDDRHLCHCPDWKDLNPTASPVLTFEEAIERPALIGRPEVVAIAR